MSKEQGPFANMPKDKDVPFTMNGRAIPLPLRRLQRIAATPVFKLVTTIILVIFGIRWVLDHNHDRDEWPGAVRPTASVESNRVKWDDKRYIQIVADEERLCSAVLVWHEIEEIGSRAQRYVFCLCEVIQRIKY